jgi:hypothetical protein
MEEAGRGLLPEPLVGSGCISNRLGFRTTSASIVGGILAAGCVVRVASGMASGVVEVALATGVSPES